MAGAALEDDSRQPVVPQGNLPALEAQLPRIEVVRPANFIFAHHETAADAAWSLEQVRDVLSRVDPTTPVLIWRESKLPENMPQKVAALQELYDREIRPNNPEPLPQIDFKLEIAAGRWAPWTEGILEQIYDGGAKAWYETVVREINRRDLVIPEDFDEWQKTLDRGFPKLAEGRTISFDVELAPYSAYIAELISNYHQDRVFEHLANGNLSRAIDSHAKACLHSKIVFEERDRTVVEAVKRYHASNPDAVQIVLRGSFHSDEIQELCGNADSFLGEVRQPLPPERGYQLMLKGSSSQEIAHMIRQGFDAATRDRLGTEILHSIVHHVLVTNDLPHHKRLEFEKFVHDLPDLYVDHWKNMVIPAMSGTPTEMARATMQLVNRAYDVLAPA